MIKLKRVYDPPAAGDGRRFLVERLWPRGMKKESLLMEEWLKNVAPSTTLRQWFGHDLDKWEEFRLRYEEELTDNAPAVEALLGAARTGTVTLLYSAHDQTHNSALVLQAYLEKCLQMS